VKKTNELGNFEGVRRVKEQKKKAETNRETEERRGEERKNHQLRSA
jgi:hypothetical protein